MCIVTNQPKLFYKYFKISRISYTTSVPICLFSIPFWGVPKYYPMFKNKSH